MNVINPNRETDTAAFETEAFVAPRSSEYHLKVENDLMAPALYVGDHAVVDRHETPGYGDIGLLTPLDGAPFFVRMKHDGAEYFKPDAPSTMSFENLDGIEWNYPVSNVLTLHRVMSVWRPEPNACECGFVYDSRNGYEIRRSASFEPSNGWCSRRDAQNFCTRRK